MQQMPLQTASRRLSSSLSSPVATELPPSLHVNKTPTSLGKPLHTFKSRVSAQDRSEESVNDLAYVQHWKSLEGRSPGPI